MNNSGLKGFFVSNKKALGAVTLAVFIAVVGVLLWKEGRARKEHEATNMLFDAQAQARPLVAARRFDQAVELYAPLLAKYPKSRAGYEARLLMGDIWMDAENFAEAAKHYEAAAQAASDEFSLVLARYNVGVARESAGEHQAAIASYEAALKAKGSEFLRPEILMAEARCYEALSQNGKAIELYKTVQEKYAAKTYYSGAASAYEKQLSAKRL